MRKLIIILFLLSFPITLNAQTICAPCSFEWDPPTDLTGITEYRLYMSETSGSYDWSTPALTVPVSSAEGDIISAANPGTWYVVAVSSDGSNISQPSNEVAIQWPLGADQTPGNLRLKVVVGADGSLTIDVERVEIAPEP